MNLEFQNKTDLQIDKTLFEDLLSRLPQLIPNIPEESVEFLLTGNEEIQHLNKTYRQKDKVTDVLSFAERETRTASLGGRSLRAEAKATEGSNRIVPQNSDFSLGQIVISLERAKEQAADLGHPLEEELRFLFTHGLLHLLGYDHENREDEEEMKDMAYRLLGRKAL